jgi:hypothetical protein
MPFTCSICGEESTRICVRCTKDACDNHLCDKCHKCSDCCECEIALAPPVQETVREVLHPVVEQVAPPPAVVEPPAAEAPVAEAAPPEPLPAPDSDTPPEL